MACDFEPKGVYVGFVLRTVIHLDWCWDCEIFNWAFKRGTKVT